MRVRPCRLGIVLRRVRTAALVVGLSVVCGRTFAEPNATGHRFDFGAGEAAPGFVRVPPTVLYDKEKGYGFEPGSTVSSIDRGGDPLRGDFCTSDEPFLFSVALPEGNYRVTVTLGDPSGESDTVVKAESRRLMVERVKTTGGKVETRTFTVNVRTPRLESGGQVRLNDRERGVHHWDEKLTLEFNGGRPCVGAVEIVPAADAVTVFLAGDSTVTDQPHEPWNSWGQMLTRFFGPGVAVANHAESGRTLRSFSAEKRLEKVLGTMKPGDYLFIQFGHNDQKEKGPGVGATTTYKADLERYVASARERGGIPVLVTPVNRRTFDAAGKVANSLGEYPAAVRLVAKEQDVPLIDLHAASAPFYEALGREGSLKAFVDNTHHNAYGSYQLAKCVVEGIRRSELDLAKHLADDVPAFDPGKPDPIESFGVPASPRSTTTKPEGN